ncbi:FtsX-like permease family protein [Oerskovia sp. NPDC057915]|uniref:FtsX-like permease family protein n=1 Tax=Oerskovia sp. NPDC057915 TaxID=3346280 RepID=UPI0036DA3F65
MKAILDLWWLLRRRSSDSRDPQGLTNVLAIIAFAATTAILLVVVGGVGAFLERAGGFDGMSAGAEAGASSYDGQYPIFAAIASLLLLIPLVTLGGAAARLAVARRDARLASLRLAGATTGQVATLTVLDAAAQVLVGALLGLVGYAALLPLVAQLRFQGRTFELSELWVGVPALLLAVVGVVLVALVSAAVSLRRVAITPLGVAARVTPPGMKAVRLVSIAVAFVAMLVVTNVSFGGAGVTIAVLTLVLVAGFATLNVVGPFVIWVVGRLTARAARNVPTLLAGRRIVDSPKTAWRSVGGVALATFIAGITSIFALFDPGMGADPEEVQFLGDLVTGGFLTLAIAGVLAAVSTGVMQAGRVIDQRGEYRALTLAGTDLKTLDKARFRETVIPLAASVGLATVASLMFMAPVLGLNAFANADVVLQFLACVAGASALVLAGAAASRFVVRSAMAA